MEVVVFKIYLTRIHFWSKRCFFDQQKGQKRSNGPNTYFWTKTKRGGGGEILKMLGTIWTCWVSSTGPHLQGNVFDINILGTNLKMLGKFYRAPPLRNCFHINILGKHRKMLGKFYMAPPSRTCFLYKHIGKQILKMFGIQGPIGPYIAT